MGLTITGGRYKGHGLRTDKSSRQVRPTSGKVREALFSALGPDVPGSSFLDLFAGSGSVGLEALSRGADRVYLVERDPAAYALLQANCRKLIEAGDAPGRAWAVRADAGDIPRRLPEWAAAAGEAPAWRPDLVFIDPPFGNDFDPYYDLLSAVLAPAGTGVIQFPSRRPPAWLARADKVRKYGESGLAFFRGAGAAGPGRGQLL